MHENKIINVGVAYNGILYNSYLLKGEKNTLIDTVPPSLSDKYISILEKHIPISNIDYLIINHAESDRSGCVGKLLKINPDITVISTISGIKNIEQQLNSEFKELVAKSGMEINISDNITLKFLITHNINWPDSMMTYYEEEETLFSCDAFSSLKSENGIRDYFDNYLYYMSEYVKSSMELLKSYDIKEIYPGCGNKIIGNDVIDEYLSYCEIPKNDKKLITIVYNSFSGNTLKAVEAAQKLLTSKGANVNVFDASDSDKSTVLKSIDISDGIIFASPTVYRNITEDISSVLMSLNHYKMADKIFCAIGSFGWSGEAANLIYSILRARHFQTFKTPFRWMFSLSCQDNKDFEKYLSDYFDTVCNQ